MTTENPRPPSPAPATRRPAISARQHAYNVLISVTLGVMIWAYVDSRRMVTHGFDVELRVRIPAEWQLEKPLPPERIEVQVRGPRLVVSAIQEGRLSLAENILAPGDNADSFNRPVTLLPEKVTGLPEGVDIVDISPKQVDVRLARLITKSVPVEVTVAGVPAQGYSVGRKEAEPSVVELRAPKRIIDLISPTDTVKTEPVDVTGKMYVETRYVRLQPLERDGEQVKAQGTVYARVLLPEIPSSRDLEEKIPVRVLADWPPTGLETMRLTPAAVAVRVTGPELALSKLTAKDIVVYVDMRDKIPTDNPGVFMLKCVALAPEKVTVAEIKPPRVAWSQPGAEPPPPEAPGVPGAK